MLESLSIPHYSPAKGSDNVMGADNQQERLKIVGWIVGFVDGEGCFSVAIQRCRVVKLGWQVFPEFVVTQGARSLVALESLQQFFQCGRIHINRRHDNHKEPLYRFCVRPVKDLREKIIPFFRENPLRTAKLRDFELFASVLELMEQRKHLSMDGLREIADVARQINRQKNPLFLESSETIRQVPAIAGKDIVRAAWRHAEAGRNDQPTGESRE
jgi:LAGLIDADG endonuclease